MFLTLKTVMVTSVAVGGLATGVAGASPPPSNDVVQSVTAASAEEAQLHASIDGLRGTEHQLEAMLADRLGAPGLPLADLTPPAGAPTPGTATAPSHATPGGGPPAIQPPGPAGSSGAPSPGRSDRDGSPGSSATTEPDPPTTTTSPPTTEPPTTTTTTAPPAPTTTTTRPRRDGGDD
jgi:hypothetical protein